jgi:UDP-2,3-diacylglucosamine pyrophosphatase LpxH
MNIANVAGTRHVTEPPPRQFRTLFVSDLHLGAKASRADAFIDFLRHNDADTIYLVGDIIDFWSVKRSPLWTQSHSDVLQKLLRKARKGTKIIYIPGNHDAAVRDYCGMAFGAIEIRRDAIHQTAGGRRFLVMHGDEFDIAVRYARWFTFLGDRSYEFALWCNGVLNGARRLFGLDYWSLYAYLKSHVQSAAKFIGQYEQAMAQEARRRGASGVICGHIHHLADRTIGGIRYINCGDWIESCTAIAEDYDGRLHQIRWHRTPAPSGVPVIAPLPAALSMMAAPE